MNPELTFGTFCETLTKFYENDDLSPGLHISWIDNTPDGEVGLWYLAIHRYPYTGERRMDRVIVCNQTRLSFGIALNTLWRIWNHIKHLDPIEEQRRSEFVDENGHVLTQSAVSRSQGITRRARRNRG